MTYVYGNNGERVAVTFPATDRGYPIKRQSLADPVEPIASFGESTIPYLDSPDVAVFFVKEG